MNESTKRALLPNADLQSDFSSLRKLKKQKTSDCNLVRDSSETFRKPVRIVNVDKFCIETNFDSINRFKQAWFSSCKYEMDKIFKWNTRNWQSEMDRGSSKQGWDIQSISNESVR